MGTLQDPNGTRPTAAAVITMLGGLWMLVLGGMTTFGRSPGMMGGMGEGEAPSTMHTWMWHHEFMNRFVEADWWPTVGSVAGLLTVIMAALIYAQPRGRMAWGAVALVTSAVGLATGAGGIGGGALGMLGGVLAMTWRRGQ